MLRRIIFFLILGLIVFLHSKAYAGVFSDLQSMAKGAIANVAGQEVGSTTNEGGGLSTDESKLAYAELNKGIYGIPLGVNLQEVLKWCEENKVIIINTTKQETEETVRFYLGKIKCITKDTDKEQISILEKEFQQCSSEESMDIVDEITLSQTKDFIDDFKSPSFEYGGKTFLLERNFRKGENVNVGGVEKVCTDKRITGTTYSLNIAPSDKSEKLLNNNLDGIRIYFKKDNSGSVISYASIAQFSDRSMDVLTKQYNSVFNVLTEKYGKPVYREKLGMERNELNFTTQGVTHETIKDSTPEGDIYRLIGISFVGSDALLWKKNIILTTQFLNNNLSFLGEHNFYVIYYEPNIAKALLDSYKQTIKDFTDACSKEDINKKSQMKENF